MNPNSWPKDPQAEQALVALVLADVQEQEPVDRDTLLYDFLRIGWPSPRAQRQ